MFDEGDDGVSGGRNPVVKNGQVVVLWQLFMFPNPLFEVS